MENQVTTGYCCEWLLCDLGGLLQATAVRGNHIFLSHLVCQKWKLQIYDCLLSVRNNPFNGKPDKYMILYFCEWMISM